MARDLSQQSQQFTQIAEQMTEITEKQKEQINELAKERGDEMTKILSQDFSSKRLFSFNPQIQVQTPQQIQTLNWCIAVFPIQNAKNRIFKYSTLGSIGFSFMSRNLQTVVYSDVLPPRAKFVFFSTGLTLGGLYGIITSIKETMAKCHSLGPDYHLYHIVNEDMDSWRTQQIVFLFLDIKMQRYFDEIEYLKNYDDIEEENDMNGETQISILKVLKLRIFKVFFRLNTMKISIPFHYHMFIIIVEALQLLTLVLVDGEYSDSGAFDGDSPWNLEQIQWLIDVCWVFRFDRYFRTSMTGFIIFIAISNALVLLALGLGILLVLKDKSTSSVMNFIIKVLKALITILTNLMLVPIVDIHAFAIRCSFTTSDSCEDLQEGYEYMIIYLVGVTVYLGVVSLSALMYYDLCQFCGGSMAKPHPRFKLQRIASYVIIIFSYYFIQTDGKNIFYLVVCLLIGIILIYVYTQYIPYYNLKLCKLRLVGIVAFTSAIFCSLIGEFFKSTDQNHSSITVLFYFLTPCLMQIMQLATAKRGKTLISRGISQLTNPYQVEIKARMLVQQLQQAKNKYTKLANEGRELEQSEQNQNLQSQTLNELESLFSQAFKKFPNAQYLYLWAGLCQLHIFQNFILAMVYCFKGIMISNKLDSQYALYHFRRTSQSFYKAHMKDDAYDYELFEKALQIAQKNDQTVTRSQFYFWNELESRNCKIQKLNKLAGQTTTMILVTKSNYQRLLKLNSKNTQALRMYGWFLSSLDNSYDVGQRYLAKAEMQEEAQQKNVNVNSINSLTQPLSFFDSDNPIIRVSGDFQTIGEIQKANAAACQLLGYLPAEVIGRNISLIIPSPFSENHDEFIKRFHQSGHYSIIDNQQLVLYFSNKNNHIIEARLLLKVVPNEFLPPYFLAIIKPTQPPYETILINNEWIITGYSQKCTEYFDLGNTKNTEQKISNIISRFEELKEEMMSPQGAEYLHTKDYINYTLRFKLQKFQVGGESANVLRIQQPKTEQEPQVQTMNKPSENQVSSILAAFGAPVQKQETQSSASKSNREQILPMPIQLEGPEKISESEALSSEEESSSEQGSEQQDSESQSGESEESQTEQSKDISGIKQELESFNKKKQEQSKESGLSGGSGNSQQGSENSASSEILEDSEQNSSSHSASMSVGDQQGQPDANQHSSSKSSVASLAQYNKSIKALVTYEYSKTKKFVLRFKITLILTIIVLIITSIVTFAVIDTSVQKNQQLSHYVNLVGNMRLYTQSLSYYSRMISLMDTGIIESTDRDTYFSWMEQDIEDMHDIHLLLYKNYDLLDSDDRDVYINEDIPTWLLEGSNIRQFQNNLFDATSNIILQGFLLKQEYEAETISLENRRAFYLYRNGNGQTLKYLNNSAQFYVNSALSQLQQQRLTAILLIVASVILLCFCAGFAIIPSIRALQKSKREVWEIFYQIPPFVCRVMKGKCSERLNILNEQANLELQQNNPEQSHPVDHQNPRQEAISKQYSKKEEKTKIKKSKKKNDQKKILSYDPKQRKITIFKLVCFFVISLAYFYLIYYTGFQAVGQILKEEPIHINWASRRRQLSRATNMWVMETLFQNYTQVGYKYVIPTGQNIAWPKDHAYQCLQELDFVQNSLIFGNEDQGIEYSELKSDEHEDLLFQDACDVEIDRSKEDCDTVGDKAMTQGLHSALGVYTNLAKSLLNKISDLYERSDLTDQTLKEFFNSDEDMILLRDMDNHYLYDPLMESSELYEDDYFFHKEEMKVWQNVLMSLYCVFSLLIFFVVYSPMINRIGKDNNNAWNMCTLIPQEFQEEFKKLSGAIKSRRDNFKWR